MTGASRDHVAEFEDFVRRHGRALARSAALVTADPHLGQDAVQGALAQTWANWKRVSAADDPLAFTRRIVYRRAVDSRRRPWRRERSTEVLPDRPTCSSSDASGDRDVLVAALRRLPSRQRAAVVLRHWEGLSVAEACDVLRMSPNALSSATSRGLAQLRRDLNTKEHVHE